ncbi:MAG: methionine gamma-lyase family protein [Clostridia bacterium]
MIQQIIDKRLIELSDKIVLSLDQNFKKIDKIAQLNQDKVLAAFCNNKISDAHLSGTTGYGYDDYGRDAIENIYSEIFGGEDAIVRHSIVSGTHALAISLFGVLRPGDTMLSVTSKPYDTLEEVIGIKDSCGSLKEFGVNYEQIDFKNNDINYAEIKNKVNKDVKVVFIQRSKGYLNRPSLSVYEIGKISSFVKALNKDVVVIVDNCYGEFVEEYEPLSFGADLIVGSLIKNPGGGIAKTGGYIVGNKNLIEKCATRLSCPGIGKECGASLNQNSSILQGVFLAPHTTAQALKTAVFASALFELFGFSVNPKKDDERNDIIQIIELKSREKVLDFCAGIQKGSPVNSFATPIGAPMPGYESEVVMAAGTFVQGASIELSADAPLKEPYNVFFQGGLTFESGKTGILFAANELLKNGYISL